MVKPTRVTNSIRQLRFGAGAMQHQRGHGDTAKLVGPVKAWLASTDLKIPWPGLDGNVLTATGAKNTSTVYTLPWLSGPGTSLLICSLITAVVYGVTMAAWGKELKETAYKMRFAFLTVSSVLALPT